MKKIVKMNMDMEKQTGKCLSVAIVSSSSMIIMKAKTPDTTLERTEPYISNVQTSIKKLSPWMY